MCNRNCDCDRCNRFIKTNSVSIVNNAVNYVIPTQVLKNLEEYCLVFCQALPVGAGTLPIVVTDGTTVIPLMCRKGNTLRADQIKTRCRYKIAYGNDPIHIIVCSPVRKTGFVVV